VAWEIFTGTGRPAQENGSWRALPAPPSWRDRRAAVGHFVIGPDLRDAVNAALHLRRPLLLTGAPGSGKSTLVSLIAQELQLGDPLNWHITSHSTLNDGLFQYDALGRLHATQTDAGRRGAGAAPVAHFVTLGPLGTALASADRPRAVLIDEIDKSDFDLPGDLLNVLEDGDFDIPPLVRDAQLDGRDGMTYFVRGADRGLYSVENGVVRRKHWPVIVLTSNGERTFPAPFLRRCVRFEMPVAVESFIRDVAGQYFDLATDHENETIAEFARRLVEGESLALDQLLNYLHVVTGEAGPDPATRDRVSRILLEELHGR